MTIYGSPWDKIKQLEQYTESHIEHFEKDLNVLNTRLLVLDHRLAALEESMEIAKKKPATSKTKKEDNS